MRSDLSRLHHVGHIVADMAEALAFYRRLGFVVPPPAYPAMARHEGAVPVPFGAANTHADFPRNFIELATVVRDGDGGTIPADATLVPLHAPAEALPTLLERISTTSANLVTYLDRFEGMHILMFSAPDIHATAARLTATGTPHGGVNTVRRPVATSTGTRLETVRYLEIDGDRPGSVPEGRVGVVADLDPETQGARSADHPNGAVDLVEVVLCVAEAELAAAQARYTGYLGRAAHQDGATLVFELDGGRVVLVPDTCLDALLPGECPAALPALVACVVAVRNLAMVEKLLRDNEVPVRRSPAGDLFVPATAALGAAIAFRVDDGLSPD